MKNVIMKCVIKQENGSSFIEELNVPKENPTEGVITMLNNFNATLRPGEQKRSLVFGRVLKSKEGNTKHEWDKTNLVTIIKGRFSYDTYKCSICGITGKRFGLNNYVIRDDKYNHTKYENCNWKFKTR